MADPWFHLMTLNGRQDEETTYMRMMHKKVFRGVLISLYN